MNTKLVDSLVQIIESLSPEDNVLLREKLRARAIRKTPGVCGGHARVRNTRIPVWTLVSLRCQGADDAELLRDYPTLDEDDLAATWNYYEHHRQEIDQLIESHRSD